MGASVAAMAQINYSETVLYNFVAAPMGSNPSGALTRDSAGDVYGTTEDGGAFGQGEVFKVDPAGRLKILWHHLLWRRRRGCSVPAGCGGE